MIILNKGKIKYKNIFSKIKSLEKNPLEKIKPIKLIALIKIEIKKNKKEKFILLLNRLSWKDQEKCKKIPIFKNKSLLKIAWIFKWINLRIFNFIDKQIKIKEIWFKVESAIIFFRSISFKDNKEERKKVIKQ